MNDRLCLDEVGVDPEPRVRAHGYNVEFIMKASCKDNCPLGIKSSCIYDRVPCDHGSDHDILH